MKDTTKGPRKPRDLGFAECCGQVCDGRCRDAAVQFRAFERRLSTPGSVRMS